MQASCLLLNGLTSTHLFSHCDISTLLQSRCLISTYLLLNGLISTYLFSHCDISTGLQNQSHALLVILIPITIELSA